MSLPSVMEAGLFEGCCHTDIHLSGTPASRGEDLVVCKWGKLWIDIYRKEHACGLDLFDFEGSDYGKLYKLWNFEGWTKTSQRNCLKKREKFMLLICIERPRRHSYWPWTAEGIIILVINRRPIRTDAGGHTLTMVVHRLVFSNTRRRLSLSVLREEIGRDKIKKAVRESEIEEKGAMEVARKRYSGSKGARRDKEINIES